MLIVDAIADSGITVLKVKELLLSDYAVENVEIATMYVNTDNCFAYSDYWGSTIGLFFRGKFSTNPPRPLPNKAAVGKAHRLYISGSSIEK